MGRVTLIVAVLVVTLIALMGPLDAVPASAATSGLQGYEASNQPTAYSTTSPTFGTATATIQQTEGQSSSGGWTFCGYHAVDGTSCAAATHVPAGTVSGWIDSGATTLVTLPNGAGCYQHTDSSGVTWCYAGEPVQDSVGTTGGPFGAPADTSVASLPGQGEAWWGSGGGPNDVGACEGMFGNAPSDQASLPSCEQQFGTVTWDTSGSTVASIRSVADEMAWRIGSWNGGATPGGVSCGGRTAIGGIAADSQAPNGLWMQWSSGPSRGYWNCTAQDGSAGPPQPGWNGTSWYSRAASDWNGFGWYLVYYDYASFIELPASETNGVATSISCNGASSGTAVSGSVPTAVTVAIDEGSGVATFSDQAGSVLSEVSCGGVSSSAGPPSGPSSGPSDGPSAGPSPGPQPSSPPTTGGDNRPTKLYAQAYTLTVPVGETGAINVLSEDVYHGTPQLSLTVNSTQPGALDTDPNSIDFGYFTWSPTSVDQERAEYQLCDTTGCASAAITLMSSEGATSTTTCEYWCGPFPSTTVPPTTTPPSPDVTLTESPTLVPTPGEEISLTGTARNPVEPTWDLSLQRIDDGALVSDCGQVLTCQSDEVSMVAAAHRYVAVLSYPSAAVGAPSQTSNEIDVTWGWTVISLRSCVTASPCNDVTARPSPGAPVYLTATANNAPPVDEGDDIYWKLVILDRDTNQPVGACAIGLSPCQVSVSEPAGTVKAYVAVFTWQYASHPNVDSNQVDVTWGGGPPPPPSTTAPPPPSTTAPPTSPPPSSPPPSSPPPSSPPPSSPPSTLPGALSPT